MNNYEGGIHKQKKSSSNAKDKSPYLRKSEAITKEGFRGVDFSVLPVAKDTNKTRRPKIKPTSSRKNTKY